MKKATRAPRLRIVSLAPNVTSILIGLGARRKLVGVSKWCAEVADVGRLPRLGDCWAMDIEPLRRLKADIVIGSVPFKPEVVAKILELPVVFVASNPRSLADIEKEIRLLGGLVGRATQAEDLVRRMRRGFSRVAKRARRARSRPRVYCEAWPNPRITSPPWVRELVEFAGGRFVLPAGQRVSDKDVARARPDVIILAWTATRDRARTGQALQNPAWKNIPAVRNRRVVVIRDELLNTPGPPLVRGAERLLAALHPELTGRGRKSP
jgi:ABC-type Fe3+-hydroxamate transport system substrate-binding protein